ncbi:MAG: hypothetical protein SGJ18_14050 [Pseudomonadota bacterium]|nr:hypothetical protein [Pseudomonadota bacterium]
MYSLYSFRTHIFYIALIGCLVTYQNCSNVKFSTNSKTGGGVNVLSCDPQDIKCIPAPLVDKPGVVTILLAFGDSDNLPNPTVDQVSAQLVAEKMVQYASPVTNPKVLVVLDLNHHGESPDDFRNLWQNLLFRYSPNHIDEPVDGLKASDLIGYDVVWLVNPGFPMGKQSTFDTLKAFAGGVILSGDDMSSGNGFNTSSLTGLTRIDNGIQVTCNGQVYDINNNAYPNSYIVSLDAMKFPDLGSAHLSFTYGNDIDNTTALAELEVLVWAKPSPTACTAKRPVVVRYPKN